MAQRKHCQTLPATFLLVLLTHSALGNLFAPTHSPSSGGSNFCVWGNTAVCADDYQTYPNLCAMQAAGVNLVHYGDCVKTMNASGQLEITCKKELVTVCGMDGVTYGNSCRMEARGVKKAYDGFCRPSTRTWIPPAAGATPPVCDCPLDFKPVCTMSGSTYESNCVLLCKQQIASLMEPCATPCACPRTYDPVCGADGITYDNTCTLECVRGSVIGLGECPNIINSCDNCSAVYLPVYSKDGTGYDNLCKLHCAKASLGGYGLPPRSSNNEEAVKRKCAQCSKLYLPICGTDGKNYDNECLCSCTGKCEKYSSGRCPTDSASSNTDSNSRNCSAQPIKEVCGVDNRTYDNACYLQSHNMQLQYPSPCKLRGEYNNLMPQNPAAFPPRQGHAAVQSDHSSRHRHHHHHHGHHHHHHSKKSVSPKKTANKKDDLFKWFDTFFVGANK
jgi:hypothetical protein